MCTRSYHMYTGTCAYSSKHFEHINRSSYTDSLIIAYNHTGTSWGSAGQGRSGRLNLVGCARFLLWRHSVSARRQTGCPHVVRVYPGGAALTIVRRNLCAPRHHRGATTSSTSGSLAQRRNRAAPAPDSRMHYTRRPARQWQTTCAKKCAVI